MGNTPEIKTNTAASSPQKKELQKLREKNTIHAALTDKTKIQLTSIDSITQIQKENLAYFPGAKSCEWDNNPNFFQKGFTCKPEQVSQKIRLIRDAELTFYVVQCGDTISGIRQKLGKIPEFQYLKRPEYSKKMYGFNIRPGNLDVGMLIPIPVESKNRRLTDEQFANYCQAAINEMKVDQQYGAQIRQLLKKFSEKDLVELMLAVAKQESGGKPLGQLEFHRWENHRSAFSFSIFHVLMVEAGLTARKKLGMTEGQTYHPKNASKLFLAFLFEKVDLINKNQKTNSTLEERLPLGRITKKERENRFKKFAGFYNGPNWRKNHYVQSLKKYLTDAHDLLSDNSLQTAQQPSAEDTQRLKQKKSVLKKPSSGTKSALSPAKIESAKAEPLLFEIGETNLRQAILDTNWLTFQETKVNHLQSNTNVQLFVNRILQYLENRYPKTTTTYYPNDQIGVDNDTQGSYVIFKRGNEEAILRIPNSSTEKSERVPKLNSIGKNSLLRAILNSNAENSKTYGKNILETNQIAAILVQNFEKYLQKIYGRKVYFSSDEIAVWQDKFGPYLIFRRKGKDEIIRP